MENFQIIIAIVIVCVILLVASGKLSSPAADAAPVKLTSNAAAAADMPLTPPTSSAAIPSSSAAIPSSTPASSIQASGPAFYKSARVGGLGGNAFDFKCPMGKFATNMRVHGNNRYISDIKLKCGNDAGYAFTTGDVHPDFPNFADFPLDAILYAAPTAYEVNGAVVGSVIGDISHVNSHTNVGHAVSTLSRLECPAGSKIFGIHGGAGALVDGIGIHCVAP